MNSSKTGKSKLYGLAVVTLLVAMSLGMTGASASVSPITIKYATQICVPQTSPNTAIISYSDGTTDSMQLNQAAVPECRTGGDGGGGGGGSGGADLMQYLIQLIHGGILPGSGPGTCITITCATASAAGDCSAAAGSCGATAWGGGSDLLQPIHVEAKADFFGSDFWHVASCTGSTLQPTGGYECGTPAMSQSSNLYYTFVGNQCASVAATATGTSQMAASANAICGSSP